MAFILTYRRPKTTFSRAPSDQGNGEKRNKSDTKSKHLVRWDMLPDWYKDNRFVLNGYRDVSNSSLACFRSIFSLHNETINIYTHLVPAIAFMFAQLLVQQAITAYFPEATRLDRIVFACNMGAAIVTLILSSLYHTLMNHSQTVSNLWLRIDYVGILTLILGSFFSGIYVGFYCEPMLRTIYWSMIISLSLITSILVLHPKLQGLKYRSHRTWAFIATALSGFAPVGHGLVLYGWNNMWVRSGMPYWFLEGLVYGTGAFFFVTRIPESVWPGTFDIWCSSHQIFHIMVVSASIVHIFGVWSAFSWNYHNQRTCPALT